MYMRVALEGCGGDREGQLTFPHSEREEGKKLRCWGGGREGNGAFRVAEKRVEQGEGAPVPSRKTV